MASPPKANTALEQIERQEEEHEISPGRRHGGLGAEGASVVILTSSHVSHATESIPDASVKTSDF